MKSKPRRLSIPRRPRGRATAGHAGVVVREDVTPLTDFTRYVSAPYTGRARAARASAVPAQELIERYRPGDAASLLQLACGIAEADPVDQVELERGGLPARVMSGLCEGMRMSRLRMFEIMDLPRATMEKKIAGKDVLTGVANRRTLALLRLLAHAQDIVADSTSPKAEGFDVAQWLGRWLEIPQPSLGGKKPAELLDTEAGVSAVDRVLGALRSGVYL